MALYKDNATKKKKHKEMVDRQEKFAEENYVGLDEIGDALLDKVVTIKQMWKDIPPSRTDEEFETKYDEMNEFAESMGSEFIVLSIKLSNVVGHALNASSTKMIKKVIKFMDKYSISDKPIHDGLMRIASKRNMNGSLLDMALVVAAKQDDVEFAKYVYEFAAKNEKRKNIYDDVGVSYDYRDFGNLSRMNKIEKPERIAFEALIVGSKGMYDFMTSHGGLKNDYVMTYIKSDYFSQRLTKEEVEHVLTLKPELIDAIIEYLPNTVPDSVNDIFLF